MGTAFWPNPARRHARPGVHARGFSLIEILIVLFLLLALAAIVVPATASWFGDVHDDQIRQDISQTVRDELIEAMRSRQPRTIWVAGSTPPLRTDPASPVPPAPGRTSMTATKDTSPRPPAARWSLGVRKLDDRAEPAATSQVAPTSASGEPPVLAPLLELPRGWSIALASPSTRQAHTGSDAAGVDQDAQDPRTGRPSHAPGASGQPTEPTDIMILWPNGQVDVLQTFKLIEPGGKEWGLDLNPWTLAAAWRLEFDPAQDESSPSSTTQDTQEHQDQPPTSDPTPPTTDEASAHDNPASRR